jgi:hypothetical protein
VCPNASYEIYGRGIEETMADVGECKWFPYIPWTKTPPDTPVEPNSTDGSPVAALNIGANANFLGKVSELDGPRLFEETADEQKFTFFSIEPNTPHVALIDVTKNQKEA